MTTSDDQLVHLVSAEAGARGDPGMMVYNAMLENHVPGAAACSPTWTESQGPFDVRHVGLHQLLQGLRDHRHQGHGPRSPLILWRRISDGDDDGGGFGWW